MNRPNLSAIKRCSKCRRFKPVESFSGDKRAMDGLQCQCKTCICANGKAWREANPDKWRAARSGWKAANPDKVRAIHRNTSHKRYHQKKGGGLGASELLDWEKSQPKVCHWCGVKCGASWHVDHRLPLAKGGGHELQNLVIACPGCNMRKAARDPIEFAQSLGMLL
jgi:5-methylcytosine-specific restriction endonuclease McrA